MYWFRYLEHMSDYLYSFFRRAKPLFDLTELQEKASKELEANWQKGKIPGWEEIANETSDPGLYCNACKFLISAVKSQM